MPCHNAEQTITESIESVLSQIYPRWELIIVDDASTDSSISIQDRLSKRDERIRLLRSPRRVGAAHARNLGILAAHGRYIAFLDSDDIWYPEKLQRQLALMSNSGAALSYTAFHRRSRHGVKFIDVPETVTYPHLLQGNVIACSTAMYDRRQLGTLKMPEMLRRQDFALWLSILKKTEFAVGTRQPLAEYRLRRGSLSANKWRAMHATWRLYRDHEGLSRRRAAFSLASHVIRRVFN
jgi:teichuronic acid biosynthesis glycosyltransferase TuaG